MRNLRGFGLLSLLFAAWTSAQAATIEVSSAKNLTVVTVAGGLNFRDEEAFTDKVLRLKDAVVVLDSVGGNLVAGIEMADAAGSSNLGSGSSPHGEEAVAASGN